MNEPLRPDAPLSSRDDALGALLRRANHEFSQHIDRQASLHRLEAQLNQPAPRPLRVPVLLFAPALLALALFAWPRLTSRTDDHPGVPVAQVASAPLDVEVTLADGKTALPDGSSVVVSRASHARWQRTPRGIRVRLARGQVHCQVTKQRGDQRFVVEAGEYSFVVLGTELRVERAEHSARLDVSSGRVEVTKGEQTLAFVSAGGSWTSPEEPAAPAPSAPEPPPAQPAEKPAHGPRAEKRSEPAPAQDCAQLVKSQALSQAAECYARNAQGTGLGAELALFELARLRGSALHDTAGAVSALEEHQRRFPQGALSRQVELAHVRALAQAQRYDDALHALEPMIARAGANRTELEALKSELEHKKAGH
jgi:hypothetical protein